MSNDTNQEASRLLAEAKALQQRLKGAADRVSDTSAGLRTVADEIVQAKRQVYNIKETFLGFYERFIAPFWRIVAPLFRWIGVLYSKLWRRYAFRTDPTSGERVLSRKRSSLLIGFTVAFILAFTPTGIGDAIRFVTIEPLTDGFLMAVSKRTEVFFLNTSEEIDPDGNIHSVRGCKSQGECSEQDAAYFRIRPRLAHDIWKLIEYGNPIYVPDHVVAPIAPGVNRCEVTYYGYRMTSSWISRLLRSLEVYPIMLEATCKHLGD